MFCVNDTEKVKKPVDFIRNNILYEFDFQRVWKYINVLVHHLLEYSHGKYTLLVASLTLLKRVTHYCLVEYFRPYNSITIHVVLRKYFLVSLEAHKNNLNMSLI